MVSGALRRYISAQGCGQRPTAGHGGKRTSPEQSMVGSSPILLGLQLIVRVNGDMAFEATRDES